MNTKQQEKGEQLTRRYQIASNMARELGGKDIDGQAISRALSRIEKDVHRAAEHYCSY